MKITVKYFLLIFSLTAFSQNSEFKEGEIISRKGDTIKTQVKVLNRFRSFDKLRYLNPDGKVKKVSLDSIKSYRRGNELYETLIINSELFMLAKRIIHGPNMNLYYRDVSTSLIQTGMPKIIRDEARYKYLKDKNQNVIILSYTTRAGETPLKPIIEKILSKPIHKNKKLKKFLANYPNILEKIKNKELVTIEDVVVECNNVNGRLWREK